MKDQLITFKTAILAKNKEYKPENPSTEYVPMYVCEKISEGQEEDFDRGDFQLAITQSLLQKWLREKHNIIVVSLPYTQENMSMDYIYMIYKLASSTKDNLYFKSYEEALERGLIKALKLIK